MKSVADAYQLFSRSPCFVAKRTSFSLV